MALDDAKVGILKKNLEMKSMATLRHDQSFYGCLKIQLKNGASNDKRVKRDALLILFFFAHFVLYADERRIYM